MKESIIIFDEMEYIYNGKTRLSLDCMTLQNI